MPIKNWVLRRTTISLVLLMLCLITAGAGCVPGATMSTPSRMTNSSPGLGVITLRDLPSEALVTLQLIKNGGPFPYDQDGAVFHNYEGILPRQPDGYYREYTVATPGSPDRGARRIITGKNGAFYYTDDHYASFELILE